MADTHRVIVREAEREEWDSVLALMRRLGLRIPADPDYAERSYVRMYEENPALRDVARTSIGWVLETEGRLVGFMGNTPVRYRFGSRPLIAAVATRMGIEPDFRTYKDDLAAGYFQGQSADLFLLTTSNPGVGRISMRAGASPMPQGDYGRILFWILDGAAAGRAALRAKGAPPPLADAAGRVVSPVLAGVRVFRGRRPASRRGLDPEAIALDAVGDEFDDLWRRKLAEGPRLYACREAEDLRWHFAEKARSGRLAIIRCRRRGRLDGYLALTWSESAGHGLVRARIADIFVAADDADVIDALLAAAYDLARAKGCHVLEMVGFPAHVRQRALASRPFTRQFPAFPYYYKTGKPWLKAALEPESAWYPSLYDGDGSLW